MARQPKKKIKLPPKSAYPHDVKWRYCYKTDEFKKEFYRTVKIENVRMQLSHFGNTEKGYRGEHTTDLSRMFILNEYIDIKDDDGNSMYTQYITDRYPPKVKDTIVFDGKEYQIYEVFPMYLTDSEPFGYEYRLN